LSLTTTTGSLPAHIKAAFGGWQGNDDLIRGVSAGFPIISYKGKVWHIVEGDNRQLVANDDGDPVSSLELVILKANPHISKLFYSSGYVEGSSERPTCYSHDGTAPALDAAEPQANKCAICPRNQWGSRVTEQGARGKECADSRRLAVAPINDLGRGMLLRVPAGSLKELVTYAEGLQRRQIPYQAIVTKLSFDHTVAHQKFVFKPVRLLNEAEVAEVVSTLSGSTVDQIVGLQGTQSPTDAVPAAAKAAAAPVATPKPAPKAQVKEEDVDAALDNLLSPEVEDAPPPAPKPAAKPKAAAAEKPKPASVIETADKTLDEVLAGLNFDD